MIPRSAQMPFLSEGSDYILQYAVLFAVVIAWVFFRAKTMAGAWKMLGSLFGFDGAGATYEPTGVALRMTIVSLSQRARRFSSCQAANSSATGTATVLLRRS